VTDHAAPSFTAETLTDIEVISAYFKGARLSAFLTSVAVVRESIAQGTWVSRGRARAGKGIKDIGAVVHLNESMLRYDDPRRAPLYACCRSAEFGVGLRQADLDVATDDDLVMIAPKVPVDVTRAWLRLMVALRSIYDDLDASRPMPVLTEIGLSPKVTTTLQDANLDLDLATRRMCPLGWRWVDATRIKDGRLEVILDRDGSPVQEKEYFPKWPDDTVFGASRFTNCDCEACGKTIPSGLVVPVLVNDRAGRPLGFFFGRDCARNIFGIKDAGIADARTAADSRSSS
jgi:hypothetical protein